MGGLRRGLWWVISAVPAAGAAEGHDVQKGMRLQPLPTPGPTTMVVRHPPAAAQARPAVLYLLWAYVPDRTLWCHGVSYYPSKCVRLEGVCTNALGGSGGLAVAVDRSGCTAAAARSPACWLETPVPAQCCCCRLSLGAGTGRWPSPPGSASQWWPPTGFMRGALLPANGCMCEVRAADAVPCAELPVMLFTAA